MLPMIETVRLVIRPFQHDDWRAIHTYTADAETMTFIPEGIMHEAATRAFVAENSGDDARAHALTLRETGDLIGHLFFHPWFARAPMR